MRIIPVNVSTAAATSPLVFWIQGTGTFTARATSAATVEIKSWGNPGAMGRGVAGGAGAYAYLKFRAIDPFVIALVSGQKALANLSTGVTLPGPYLNGGSSKVAGRGASAGTGGGLIGVFVETVAHANALLIAGSGGGGNYNATGGAGGAEVGERGANSGGGGGTQLAGGAGYGTASDGAALTGGNGARGPGGGAGYYGGGGGDYDGDYHGGGGGSSFAPSLGLQTINGRRIQVLERSLIAGVGATPGNSADPDHFNAGSPEADMVDGKIMIRFDGGDWQTMPTTLQATQFIPLVS